MQICHSTTHLTVFFLCGSAPAKGLDVWYAEQGSDFKSLRVYWKVSVKFVRG